MASVSVGPRWRWLFSHLVVGHEAILKTSRPPFITKDEKTKNLGLCRTSVVANIFTAEAQSSLRLFSAFPIPLFQIRNPNSEIRNQNAPSMTKD